MDQETYKTVLSAFMNIETKENEKCRQLICLSTIRLQNNMKN